MKKAFFLFLLIPLLSIGQQKYDGCFVNLINPQSEFLTWENDTIRFNFKPSGMFWNIEIENKSGMSITCLWDETLFIVNKKSSGIVFGNTISMFKNEPKGTTVIHTGTFIEKEIFPLERVKDYGLHEVYKKVWVKDGDYSVKLVFLVMINEEKIEYVFDFVISYPLQKAKKKKS